MYMYTYIHTYVYVLLVHMKNAMVQWRLTTLIMEMNLLHSTRGCAVGGGTSACP